MEILRWMMLSLFTMFFGFVVGFGLVARNVVVAWYHLIGCVIFVFMVSISSSFMGHVLRDIISYRVVEIVFGLGIAALGVVLMLSKPVFPGHRDLTLFFAALFFDVIILGYHYGQTHDGGYGLAFTISLLLSGSIVLGMTFVNRPWFNWRIKMLLPHLPGAMILLIALFKMV